MNKHLLSWLKNEKGVTLLEILAGMIIFMLVIIPMSDVYVNGINQYNKTQAQTNLRNEADYVLSLVMKEIQDATYYELSDNTNTNVERGQVLDILESGKVGSVLESEDSRDDFKTDLVKYNILVNWENNKTNSNIIKENHNLLPNQTNTLYESESYLAYGLFKLDKEDLTDTTDPNNHKVTVYLLIVPKSKTEEITYLDGQPSAFSKLIQIRDTVIDENYDLPFEYIRVIKTEISTNNVNQG